MEIFDLIKNIANNLSDTINDISENINESINENIDTSKPLTTINKKTKATSSPKTNPIFPKIELLGTKGDSAKAFNNQLTIEKYQQKYVIDSLQNKIDSMSNQEKAYVYYYLGYKHNQIRKVLGSKIEEADIAMMYLDKALKLYPDNIDFAYEYFRICLADDLCFCKNKVIDICELCIKLSNNQDIKNELQNIYFLMGKYYYLEQKMYSKAIDCFKKALEYAKDQQLFYYRYLVILYRTIGNYKEALNYCKIILNQDPNYFDIPEMNSEIKRLINSGTTIEEENRKNYLSDVKYRFKNSVGKYPEEYLIEAYEHYQNAQNQIYQNKRYLAIKEYLLVKKMLPEEAEQINDLISLHISIGLGQNEEGMDTDILFDCLFENLEKATATGDRRALARIYNSLGSAYFDIKEYDKAVENYWKSLDISGDPFHYSNLALCYTAMGKYYEAIEIYEKIKKIAPQANDDLKPDFQIQKIKDIIAGKINPNDKIDENSKLAEEHNQKGDSYFNNHNFAAAIASYNAAFGIKKESVAYLFKTLLSKNINESPYYDESETGFKALQLCKNIEDFKYLPFLCTLYGDAISYEAWGQGKLAFEYYEIAIFFLNMVPVSERFAAPYYKLALLNEQYKYYKEALKLFALTKEIDNNYNVEDDINRVQNLLDQKEEINKQEFADASSSLMSQLIEEGKKALKYSPDKAEIYYIIANAADLLSLTFETKWAAKEGLRLDLDKYNEEKFFDNFILTLGKCCKSENKYEQAKFYFNVLLEDDEDYNLTEEERSIRQIASEELYSI